MLLEAAHLQEAVVHKLKLLAVFPGGRDEETRMHRRWEEYRAYGEYYHPSRALQSFLGIPIELFDPPTIERPELRTLAVPDETNWPSGPIFTAVSDHLGPAGATDVGTVPLSEFSI